jgi:hypothetical protein
MLDEELKKLLGAMTADILRHVDAKIDAAVGVMRVHLDARINSTNDTMHSLTDDMRLHVDARINSTNDTMHSLADDMRLHVDARINSTNDTMHSLADDMRLHFDIATEASRVRFDQLAEAIATVDEKADRNGNRLDEKIERGFAATNALIKYSYDTLDHRVVALEKK